MAYMIAKTNVHKNKNEIILSYEDENFVAVLSLFIRDFCERNKNEKQVKIEEIYKKEARMADTHWTLIECVLTNKVYPLTITESIQDTLRHTQDLVINFKFEI